MASYNKPRFYQSIPLIGSDRSAQLNKNSIRAISKLMRREFILGSGDKTQRSDKRTFELDIFENLPIVAQRLAPILIGFGVAVAGYVAFRNLVHSNVFDWLTEQFPFLGMTGPIGSLKRSKPVLSAFGPESVQAENEFVVQVFLVDAFSVGAGISETEKIATQIDPEAVLRGFAMLDLENVDHGDELEVRVIFNDEEIELANREQNMETLCWRGGAQAVPFVFRAKKLSQTDGLDFSLAEFAVLISKNGIPLGQLKGHIKIVQSNPEPETQAYLGSDDATRFSRVFVSYAEKDAERISYQLALFPALGIKYFQAKKDLKPGDDWQKRIEEEISACEAFFLFWSENAKQSEAVEGEWRLALQCQEQSERGSIRPTILPICVPPPPPTPAPPEELKSLHFGGFNQHLAR